MRVTSSSATSSPTTCSWCYEADATTTLYATATCQGCFDGTRQQRCTAWLRSIYRKREQQGNQGAR